MKIVSFTDLDDTLFYSHRKLRGDEPHRVAALLPDGRPGAYSDAQQQMLISLIGQYAIIPVTGRRTDSLQRVQLTFNSFKVASHGAIVLDEDNQLYQPWQRMLDNEEPAWRTRIGELAQCISGVAVKAGLDLRVRVIEDYGYACYVCIKGQHDHLRQVIDAQELGIPAKGFYRHINERNLAYMPPYASKRNAVAFLKKEISNTSKTTTFFGIGDSISDASFMFECDFQIIPSNSQIAGKLK
ncbi:hypothetical protein [Amphritea sp.]|uniref:hypothetical protein n=1 Tax=Amphritea sp. TaxID=1872502 RepID=UPI003D0E3EDA